MLACRFEFGDFVRHFKGKTQKIPIENGRFEARKIGI